VWAEATWDNSCCLQEQQPQLYWTADQSTSQADLCLFLCMFSPDCDLFTKHKNDQWKFVGEQLLNILSKAAVDTKEEQFTWHHAVLQEQLEEAQRALLPDKDKGQEGQDFAPPSRVDDEEGQDPELAGASLAENDGWNDDASCINQFLMDKYTIKHIYKAYLFCFYISLIG